MEIVINKCYGGFSLSRKGLARLSELQGKTAYFFDGGMGKPYTPSKEKAGRDMSWTAFSIPNPNEYFADDKPWQEMTMEERIEQNKKHNAVSLDSRPDDRTDPLLVQVVKELGAEASGGCADLRIITIPDGVEWEISEYDGIESVHEKHRSW